MKKLLILSALLVATFTKAQDCFNGGIVSIPSETIVEAIPASDISQQNSIILMPYVMKEKEVMLVMKEKNNSEINGLLKKVKLARTFQNIGFAAIPEALVGGGLIAAAVSTGGNIQQKGVGIGLVALSTVCLSSSLCFRFVRNKNYKKAIAKYNQLYN